MNRRDFIKTVGVAAISTIVVNEAVASNITDYDLTEEAPINSGYAILDSDGKIPESLIPNRWIHLYYDKYSETLPPNCYVNGVEVSTNKFEIEHSTIIGLKDKEYWYDSVEELYYPHRVNLPAYAPGVKGILRIKS